jgi:acetyl-CoA acyltransferase
VYIAMGQTAENVAEFEKVTRQEMDEFAVLSQTRAVESQSNGFFEREIVPVTTPDGTAVRTDEGVRRGTTPETLARLKPSFADDGVIHAGNASQISDGAAALLVTTPERAAELGLSPIVRYHTGVVAGDDPVLMLTGPIPATEKLLKRSGVALGEIGVFEVNEAFAPVPLAWLAETGADPARLNPLGGAIALGHPLGASGAVLMTRMIHRMRDRGLRYGLQTMCEGGGTANATLLELVAA